MLSFTGLPPLVSTDALAARLGRELTDPEQIRADALLRDASVQARRYCRKPFMVQTDDVIDVRVHDSELKLPGRPISAVTSVTAKGSPGLGLPDIPVPWFVFDQIDVIRLDPGAHGIINLPEAWWDYSDLYRTFEVVYTHGTPEVPDEVTMVVANACLGVLMAPTQAAGLIGETIGPYSYRMERGGAGLTVAFSQADKEALDDFRDKQGTIYVELR